MSRGKNWTFSGTQDFPVGFKPQLSSHLWQTENINLAYASEPELGGFFWQKCLSFLREETQSHTASPGEDSGQLSENLQGPQDPTPGRAMEATTTRQHTKLQEQ